MRKINLEGNLYVLQFDSKDGNQLGVNITVLENKNEVILIDTGYEHHMKEIKEIIKGKSIKNIICSHFHPDHCYGLHELKKQVVIGSKHSITTLKMFDDDKDDKIVPSILIEKKTGLRFGDFEITMTLNPGHSDCGMIISINDKYILTGDEIMFTNSKESVLPYVASTISQHLKGITNIKKYLKKHHILIPAHGSIIDDFTFLRRDIDVKIDYFTEILNGNIELSDFKEKHDYSFINEKWHRLNLNKKG